MIDKLENIGFYTLCDKRVKKVSKFSPMWRCELIVTDQCNFRCPYCRGMRKEYKGNISLENATNIISLWAEDGLKNIRFSGGEPTLHPYLEEMVKIAKNLKVERIAISTNGSADRETYNKLLKSGVNDFSISLDACCSKFSDKMSGVEGYFEKIIDNIEYLSKISYVTVGVVFTDESVDSVIEIIKFASDLGVSDIRIISAAQENEAYFKFIDSILSIDQKILDKNPILKYRISNIKNNIPVRGLSKKDSHRCGLLYDDSIVAGGHHFPCIIHFREGGRPIGKVGSNMREERIEWCRGHDTHEDPICKYNCLDVCVEYNNKFERLKNV